MSGKGLGLVSGVETSGERWLGRDAKDAVGELFPRTRGPFVAPIVILEASNRYVKNRLLVMVRSEHDL
jgi:hypothetical protein